LLGGDDRQISIYTTAVTRQRPVNSNKGTVFYVRFVPRCYKRGKLRDRGVLQFSCELLL
jgi:hypothetical protein